MITSRFEAKTPVGKVRSWTYAGRRSRTRQLYWWAKHFTFHVTITWKDWVSSDGRR